MKFKPACLFIVATLFVSCSNQQKNSKLVINLNGTWQLVTGITIDQRR